MDQERWQQASAEAYWRIEGDEMEYLLILVYARFGIDVFGPWPTEMDDDHILKIVESRDEQPEAVYRLTLGKGSKEVKEWKVA